MVLGAEGLQLVHMTDLDAVDLLAHLVLGHIKGGDQLVAVGVGGDEAAHGLAQTAAADQDGGQAVAVAEQQALQNGKQVLHRVTDALSAVHVADAVEVLPDLGGRGAHLGGQLPGGDAGDAVGLQRAQVAVVFREALDHGERGFCGGIHEKNSPFKQKIAAFALHEKTPACAARWVRHRVLSIPYHYKVYCTGDECQIPDEKKQKNYKKLRGMTLPQRDNRRLDGA